MKKRLICGIAIVAVSTMITLFIRSNSLFGAVTGYVTVCIEPLAKHIPAMRIFRADKWRIVLDGLHVQPRILMVDDLRNRVLKGGMTKEEIHKLLGSPDSTSKYDLSLAREGYALGYDLPGDMDPDTLLLQYDSQERLIDTFINRG